jgi:cobalamin synthase
VASVQSRRDRIDTWFSDLLDRTMLPLMWLAVAAVVIAFFAPFVYYLVEVVREPILIAALVVAAVGLSLTGFFFFDMTGLGDLFRGFDRASEKRRRSRAERRQSD